MYHNESFNIHGRLKQVIFESGLSCYELTMKTDLSKGTIQNILNQEGRLPRIDTLLEILRVLNMAISEFFLERNFDSLRPDEEKVLYCYHKLSPESQENLLKFLDTCLKDYQT